MRNYVNCSVVLGIYFCGLYFHKCDVSHPACQYLWPATTYLSVLSVSLCLLLTHKPFSQSTSHWSSSQSSLLKIKAEQLQMCETSLVYRQATNHLFQHCQHHSQQIKTTLICFIFSSHILVSPQILALPHQNYLTLNLAKQITYFGSSHH